MLFFETLHLLEIKYDLGPINIQDFIAHYTQHRRLHLYNYLLNELISTGLVYACSCSRKQLIQIREQCNCRKKKIPLDAIGVAWRLHVPKNTTIRFIDQRLGQQHVQLENEMAEFIIRKKDGFPAYQIVSLADDIYYGIDYIVRGRTCCHPLLHNCT